MSKQSDFLNRLEALKVLWEKLHEKAELMEKAPTEAMYEAVFQETAMMIIATDAEAGAYAQLCEREMPYLPTITAFKDIFLLSECVRGHLRNAKDRLEKPKGIIFENRTGSTPSTTTVWN